MQAVEIRMMKAEDIEQVAALEAEAFGAEAWSADALRDAFLQSHYRFAVAVCEEEVVGYMGMYIVVGEANVTNIAVFQAYQGQGVGKRLLTYMVNLAQISNCVGMTLEVRVSNQPAISLYQCAGFVSAGTRKQFYENPREDGEIMWKYFISGAEEIASEDME